jgi:hypothetical protein
MNWFNKYKNELVITIVLILLAFSVGYVVRGKHIEYAASQNSENLKYKQ